MTPREEGAKAYQNLRANGFYDNVKYPGGSSSRIEWEAGWALEKQRLQSPLNCPACGTYGTTQQTIGKLHHVYCTNPSCSNEEMWEAEVVDG
jgi:hypothetical protein